MNTNAASVAAPKHSGIVAERDALREENERMAAMIQNLKSYLNSSKFDDDKTVQVADVLTRIGARGFPSDARQKPGVEVL